MVRVRSCGDRSRSRTAAGLRDAAWHVLVQWKSRDHRSAEFDNAPLPFAVFFTDTGIAFHGGDLNSNSHGCVRLGMEDAEAFFNFLEVDDEVQVF